MKHNGLKLLSINIAVIFILTCVMGVSYADENIYEKYSEAINIVSKIGIIENYEDGTFQPENLVTRAEYAVMLSKLAGIDGINSQNSRFADAQNDYWASAAIGACDAIGLMGGYEDKFEPEEFITYEQVIKTLVRLIGYDMIADYRGGYPVGYFVVAQEKGIIDNNISYGSTNESITRGVLAQVIYNSLEIDIMQKKADSDSYELNAVKGENVLTEYMKLYKKTGILTATEDTSLTGESSLSDGEVMIELLVLKAGNSGAKELLGQNVEAYYKVDDNDDNVIVCIDALKNELLEIKAEDIEKVSGNNTITYTVDDKEKTARLSSVADVIFNGAAMPEFSAADLKPDSGKIVLIDNDRDEVYDVVRVTSYITYVVAGVSKAQQKLWGELGQPPIDLKDNDIKWTIYKDNEKVGFDAISPGVVFQVEASREKTEGGIRKIDAGLSSIYKFYMITNVISGTLTEETDDSLTIDGVEYKKSIALSVLIESKEVVQPEANRVGLFYIGFNNEAVYIIDRTNSRWSYGYLIEAESVKQGVDYVGEVKLLTTDNKVNIYKTKSKIYFDGKKITVDENFEKSFSADGTFEQQIIRYRLSGNLISEIDTKQLDEKYEKSDTSLKAGSKRSQAFYKTNTLTFDLKYAINQSTVVFVVPPANKISTADDEQYFTTNRDYLSGDWKYDVQPYDLSDANVADVLVVYEDNTKGGSEYLFVEKVTRCVGEEGSSYKIDGYIASEKVSYVFKNDEVLKKAELLSDDGVLNINGGDILKVYVLFDREILEVEKKFLDVKNDGTNYKTSGDFNDTGRVSYWQVYSKEGDYLLVSSSGSAPFDIDKMEVVPFLSRTNILMFNGKKCVDVSPDEIVGYKSVGSAGEPSKIVVFQQNTEVKRIIIYK